MPEPSLLDWLNSQWGQPRVQRLARLALAAVAAAFGAARLISEGVQDAAGMVGLGLAAILFLWGMAVRVPAQDAPGAAGPPLPGFSLGVRSAARPAAPGAASGREVFRRTL